MKKYDVDKKKWVTSEEYEKSRKPRDKSVCRGKKPHDYVLVLPHGVTYDDTYKFNPEVYYEIMEQRRQFLLNFKNKLISQGIRVRWSWNDEHVETKCYICSVCKKQKYEHE